MKPIHFFVAIVLLGLSSLELIASYDPSPLQDFCVALDDSKETVFVNGKLCKNPKLVVANDFFFSGLNIPGNTTNALGSGVKLVSVDTIPGLNTMGISMVRVDYAPGGEVPPHTHPRASEIVTVLKGTLYVGFVTSFPDYRLISKTLHAGDVFVFPIGLIHFQFNIGKEPAVVLGALSSQNPGLVMVANSLFGSNPPIPPNVLEKAFQVDEKVIALLQAPYKNT